VRKIVLTSMIAAMLAASSLPAGAWGHHNYYRRYDPGPAIALGLLGAFAGAAIAAQGSYGGYGYGPPAYGYPKFKLQSVRIRSGRVRSGVFLERAGMLAILK
jgi:hypothetical protein